MAQRRGEQMGNQMSAWVGDNEGWLVGFGRELKREKNERQRDWECFQEICQLVGFGCVHVKPTMTTTTKSKPSWSGNIGVTYYNWTPKSYTVGLLDLKSDSNQFNYKSYQKPQFRCIGFFFCYSVGTNGSTKGNLYKSKYDHFKLFKFTNIISRVTSCPYERGCNDI